MTNFPRRNRRRKKSCPDKSRSRKVWILNSPDPDNYGSGLVRNWISRDPD